MSANESQSVAVTVVVPVWNKEAYVASAVASALSQEVEGGLEVVAVDDGSEDQSAAILDCMAAADRRLRVLHVENGGVTAARRLGVEAARGRTIAFLDADDRIAEGGLAALLAVMDQTGADEVIGTARTQTGALIGLDKDGEVDAVALMRGLLSLRTHCPVLWGVLFRRELLDGCLTAPRTVRSGEDTLMQLSCLARRPRVWATRSVAYVYTVGLPNGRARTLRQQQDYDEALCRALAPVWDEVADHVVLHQLKKYELYVSEGHVGALARYFRPLRHRLPKTVGWADRLAIMLPPWLAYVPIKVRKWLL